MKWTSEGKVAAPYYIAVLNSLNGIGGLVLIRTVSHLLLCLISITD